MTWFVLVAACWCVVSVAVGLVVGGAVALDERSAGLDEPPIDRRGSGLLGERSLDGERAARALQVHEEGSLIG